MSQEKPVRWTAHALRCLATREIDRAEADVTVARPDAVVPGQSPRQVLQRRYFDRTLGREMLLRVIVEDRPSEVVVVTAYKTSRFDRYEEGLAERRSHATPRRIRSPSSFARSA